MNLYDEFRDQAEQIEARQGFKCTEDQIRSIVGAPSIAEDEMCMCGILVNDCPDSYEHMTHGC